MDEVISELMSFLGGSGSSHVDLIRPRLKTVSSRLRDDEHMKFKYRGSSARYDQAQGRKFTAKGDVIELYDSMYGKVTEVDIENRAFKLSAVPDKGVRRVYFQLFDVSGPDDGVQMDVTHLSNRVILVTGTFNEAQDGSRNVKSIDAMEEIRSMWIIDYWNYPPMAGGGENDDEMAPNAERIRLLIDNYDRFATGLRLPHIFPTVDGNLEFEWDSDDLSVLKVDLSTTQGIPYIDDGECKVHLESSEGWAVVITRVGTDVVGR